MLRASQCLPVISSYIESLLSWAYPEQFGDVILRLGEMHMLMSFIGSVEKLIAKSGLGEILESTFGVAKMLSGKKFPQKTLRLLVEELTHSSINREELNS